MVLAARQEQSFSTLWSTPGAVNDPNGDKHARPLQEVIMGGTFKSSIIDNWETEDFDSVSSLCRIVCMNFMYSFIYRVTYL